jgi:cell division protein FtsZ
MRAVKRPTPTLQPVATDYAGLDKPAVQRFARAVGDGMGGGAVDEELLDIPAFLRRQAD